MEINSLSAINSLQLNDNRVSAERTNGPVFEAFFNAALGLLEETNAYQIDAERQQLDYVSGKTDDIIALNMAQAKASSALQFTTQVTSKILTAYQEIMRMQL